MSITSIPTAHIRPVPGRGPAAACTLAMLLAAACLLAGGCSASRTLSPSESVQLQPTLCYERPDGSWVVGVRGGVYKRSWLNHFEPDVISWLHSHHVVGDDAEQAILESRLNLFLEDHPKGVALSVRVGQDAKPLPVSDKGGRILGTLVLTAQEVQSATSKTPPNAGWLTLPVCNSGKDARDFKLESKVLAKKGISVVSDIDDTIKITDVNNTKLMIQNTLLLPFRSVPGMAQVYSAWEQSRGASFFYLSESPLELYPPLVAFLAADGFPKGAIDLREINWEGSRFKGFIQMAEAPPQFKLSQLKHLINALPERDYVLVGDSSQHDPEVYAETARNFPKQVKRILIRDVTCQERNDPRYEKTFQGLPPELWQIFREPVEIRDAIPAGLG